MSTSVSRRGEKGIIRCHTYLKQTDFWRKGDYRTSFVLLLLQRLVLVDSENALATDSVRAKLERYGVKLLIYPTGLGHLMNPVELFNSEVKRRYWKILSEDCQGTLDLQVQAMTICQAYYGGKEKSVKAYFRHVGLIGTEEPLEVMKKLLLEGARPSGSYRELHEQQMRAYRDFKNSVRQARL